MDVRRDGELIELEEAGARVLVLGGPVVSRLPTRCCAASSPTPRGCPPTTSSSSTPAACAGPGTGASASPYPLTRVGRVLVRGRRRLGRRDRRRGGDAASARRRHGVGHPRSRER